MDTNVVNMEEVVGGGFVSEEETITVLIVDVSEDGVMVILELASGIATDVAVELFIGGIVPALTVAPLETKTTAPMTRTMQKTTHVFMDSYARPLLTLISQGHLLTH